MGAYRDQLLKETYGSRRAELMVENRAEPSGFLTVFKIRFTICLILFGGFAYMNLTGESFFGVTAEQVVSTVTDESFYETMQEEFSGLAL
ncbi:MAG: hypothetical protein LUC60_02980 [Lachnospiraceae bacterium]|nr:hypothetical protein [Lachnospiraceae bacterium]